MAFYVQRFEDHRRARNGLWDSQRSLRTHPHDESIPNHFRHPRTDTESRILVLDQPFTLCH